MIKNYTTLNSDIFSTYPHINFVFKTARKMKNLTNVSWSDENFDVSMRDARGYFIRHIFKKIMRFNWLKK